MGLLKMMRKTSSPHCWASFTTKLIMSWLSHNPFPPRYPATAPLKIWFNIGMNWIYSNRISLSRKNRLELSCRNNEVFWGVKDDWSLSTVSCWFPSKAFACSTIVSWRLAMMPAPGHRLGRGSKLTNTTCWFSDGGNCMARLWFFSPQKLGPKSSAQKSFSLLQWAISRIKFQAIFRHPTGWTTPCSKIFLWWWASQELPKRFHPWDFLGPSTD